MPSSTAPRAGGPRRHLTLQQKVLIIEKREREGLKQDELAQWAAAAFALPSVPTQPTISNILKDKDKLREALRLNPQRRVKTVRDVTCPRFEDAVVQWILERTTTGGAHADPRPVDRRAVLEFASGARAQFPRAKDLALSEGWLSRLIERRGITLRPSDGAEQEETEARADEGDDDQDEQNEDDAESANAGTRASRRRSAEPGATAARRSLQTPPRDRRTSGTHAMAAAAVASPAWSEVASPVFASTPVQTRPRRPQGVTSSTTSGPHSPVALRSLASAASPLAARSARDEPRGVDAAKVYQQVCEYYGSHLTKRDELRTDAATHALGDGTAPLPALLREILEAVPDAVKDKSFGCGIPLPLGIQGLHALDLGCGSGRDAYALSALVGATGSVTGVDMTPPLLTVAERHVAAFTERLRSARSSLHFVHGYMEYLDQAGIESDSMDLAIANFAVSLTPNKTRTLKEVFRVLHAGGEFQCSDVFAARRVPDRVRDDAVLFCEGLGGAMYIDDFRALCRDVGFGEPRVVSVAPLTITDEALARCVGAAASQYVCVTYRCFKLPDLMEMRAAEEDYGHVVKYLGSVPGHEAVYALDSTYRFEARRPVRVGGNTAAILKRSWLARHFHVEGDWSEHFGRFVPTPSPSSRSVVEDLFR